MGSAVADTLGTKAPGPELNSPSAPVFPLAGSAVSGHPVPLVFFAAVFCFVFFFGVFIGLVVGFPNLTH